MTCSRYRLALEQILYWAAVGVSPKDIEDLQQRYPNMASEEWLQYSAHEGNYLALRTGHLMEPPSLLLHLS